MITLGINPFSHDSSAAVVRDGQIIAASTEERFNREKHSAKIPVNAVKFCLEKANIKDINDISEISFSFNFWHWKVLWFLDEQGIFKILPHTLREKIKHGDNHLFNLIKNIFNIIDTRIFIQETLGYKGPIAFHDHHDTHAAATYFASGYSTGAIITVDGRGERASTRIYNASDTRINRLLQINYPHSLGLFYTSITHYLGFLRNCDEGKVMGLSSYGTDRYIDKMNKLVTITPQKTFRLNLTYFSFWWNSRESVSKKFIQIFGPKRNKKDLLTTEHQDIAKAAQVVLEKALIALVHKAKELTQEENLCIAGGVGLNSVTNGIIIKEKIFNKVYIYPASGDDGTAVGAAFLSYYKYAQNKVTAAQNRTPYLGYTASEDNIIKALNDSKLACTRPENIFQETAKLLAEGKFIGWYQGAAEFGPRALGNRSILADPRKPENKDLLNAKVKFRESFRPFAPSVLKEEAPEYFSNCDESPYMIVTYDVFEDKKSLIPSVVHVDGTARVQTVTIEQNKEYYLLIKAFYQLTGIPVLLNTSFNVMNEPIVNTPEQAINCFLNSGLDALILHNYLITSKKV